MTQAEQLEARVAATIGAALDCVEQRRRLSRTLVDSTWAAITQAVSICQLVQEQIGETDQRMDNALWGATTLLEAANDRLKGWNLDGSPADDRRLADEVWAPLHQAGGVVRLVSERAGNVDAFAADSLWAVAELLEAAKDRLNGVFAQGNKMAEVDSSE